MSKEYLSVADFAAAAGITRQNVYEQLKAGKRLHPYAKKINGKKMIRATALSYYSPGAPEPEPEPEEEPEQPANDPVVALLMDQIGVKDKQIEAQAAELTAKNEQIKDLTETIRANMSMIYSLQTQVARLTGDVMPEDPAKEKDHPAQDKAPEPTTRSATPSQQTVAHAKTTASEATARRGGFFAWLTGRRGAKHGL